MKRIDRMIMMRAQGLSYREIGEVEGITRQRAFQLLKRASERRRRPDASLLTCAAAAFFLGIHPNTLRRWADTGILKCYRLGIRRDRRFSREFLEKFLKENYERG